MDGRGDAQRAQEEEDDQQPQGPVGQLPRHDVEQPVALVAEGAEALRDASPELGDPSRRPDAADEQQQQERAAERAPELRVLEEPAEVERRQARQDVEPGEHTLRDRPDEERPGDDHVEEGQEHDRRGEGRVGAALDAALRDVELHRVAAPRRDDGIHARSRDEGREGRPPGDARIGVRGGDHVPPGPAGDRELHEVEADRDRERLPADGREMLDEGPDRVEDRAHAPATVSGTPARRASRLPPARLRGRRRAPRIRRRPSA